MVNRIVNEQSTVNSDEEIDIRELLSTLLRYKLFILCVVTISTIISFAVALWLPNIYISEVTTVPVKSSTQGQLGSLMGQFGGLASLAGIDLPGSGADNSQLTIETLNSRQFISHFISKRSLKPILFAGKKQNSDQTWQLDSSIYDGVNNKWTRKVASPFVPEPSDYEVYKEFKKNVLNVTLDKKTGLIKISVKLVSAEAARDWVTWYVSDLNEWMRQKTIGEKTKTIEYLTLQVRETEVTEMQKVFYSLIQKEQTELMLAQTQSEYALKVIDPAVVSPEKYEPKRGIIVLVGFFGGFFLSLVILFLFRLVRNGATN